MQRLNPPAEAATITGRKTTRMRRVRIQIAAAGSCIAALAICAPGASHPPTSAVRLNASLGTNVHASASARVVTKKPTKLQRIVRSLVAAGAPGAVVFVRTPKGIRSAAAGLASLQPRVAMHVNDRYRIASVTKTFVATVALQLAAEGKLSLDDSVERWLPRMVPNGASITLRELLNHTSGLFDYDSDQNWISARIADPAREWSPQDLVAIAASHPPLFSPGMDWSYSNTNYILLGLVVEAVTGEDLAQELQNRIFEPLALGSTSYPTGTAIPSPFAHGYLVGRPPLPVPAGTLIDVSTILSPSAWGAGQLVSNARDLVTFFAALLKGRLLSVSFLAQMKAGSPASLDYGLGLRNRFTPCGKAFGHDGDIPGYRNVVWATAKGKRVASIMVNIDETRVSWSRLHAAAVSALCFG
jgi:D-alanyl-D-alanine carboxypeptidase